MTQDIDLKELEKKVYMPYHRDGMLDISPGLWILLCGIAMYTHLIPFVGLIPILVMGVGYLTKKFVTIPRMGYVNFSTARKSKERRKMSFWLVLGLVAFGAVLVRLAKCQTIYASVPHKVIFVGALIQICGLLTFIRFLRKYPLPIEGVSGVIK